MIIKYTHTNRVYHNTSLSPVQLL